MEKGIYQANLASGSLLPEETKKIAALLLQNPTKDEWHQAIVVDNLLQKKSAVTAKKQARLIKARLDTLPGDAKRMISEGETEDVLQLILAGAIKENHLLGDFLLRAVKRKWQQFDRRLAARDWELFLEECEQLSPNVTGWGKSTRSKVGEVLFRILAESRIVDSTREKNILSFQLAPKVKSYLQSENERYVLDCLEWGE